VCQEGGEQTNKSKRKRNKKRKKKDQWDPKAKNLWVYVMGLPSDATFEEVGLNLFDGVNTMAFEPVTGF